MYRFLRYVTFKFPCRNPKRICVLCGCQRAVRRISQCLRLRILLSFPLSAEPHTERDERQQRIYPQQQQHKHTKYNTGEMPAAMKMRTARPARSAKKAATRGRTARAVSTNACMLVRLWITMEERNPPGVGGVDRGDFILYVHACRGGKGEGGHAFSIRKRRALRKYESASAKDDATCVFLQRKK